MTWCAHCSEPYPPTATSTSSSQQTITSVVGKGKTIRNLKFTSCAYCGRVLKDQPFSLIRDIAASSALNHLISDKEKEDDSVNIVSDVHHLFRTTVQKEALFGRGRRAKTHTAAACFYIALCRRHKPCMLIDLSNYLKVFVYALAAVFVALSKTLTPFQDSSIVDPSLFMHRISARLVEKETNNDASTVTAAARALNIISRTKGRNWMVIPNNNHKKQKIQILIKLCSAALYIACSSQEGIKVSESQVFAAVHDEFEKRIGRNSNNELTMAEFASRVAVIGKDLISNDEEGLVCHHKKSNALPFCYGLCRECYKVFIGIMSDGGFKTKVEDYDISAYINTEKEEEYKTIIWELMNKDYLEQQSAKALRTDAAADKTSKNGDKSTKKRKQRRTTEVGTTKNVRSDRKLSSRINYDVVSRLYEEDMQQQTIDTGLTGKSESRMDNDVEVAGDDESGGAEEDNYFDDLEEDYGDCIHDDQNEYADDDFEF